jgi:hypothetical protein
MESQLGFDLLFGSEDYSSMPSAGGTPLIDSSAIAAREDSGGIWDTIKGAYQAEWDNFFAPLLGIKKESNPPATIIEPSSGSTTLLLLLALGGLGYFLFKKKGGR